MNDKKTLQDLQTLTAQLNQTGFYDSKGYYTNTDSQSILDTLKSLSDLINEENKSLTIDITTSNVIWDGHTFIIKLDALAMEFCLAIRDKKDIQLYNPNTNVTITARYAHELKVSDRVDCRYDVIIDNKIIPVIFLNV
jgi:hypothetical protein